MPSYTASLKLVLPATAEYPGDWGNQVNNSLTSIVDRAVAGSATITMTAANYTLVNANGVADEAKAMFLVLQGTPGAARFVIVPTVSKLYFVTNNTTGGFAQSVSTSGSGGVSVPNGSSMLLRCDGANVVPAINYFGTLSVGTFTGGTFVSPALTGVPTAPTAVLGTSTTQIATTAFVAATSFSAVLPGQTGNAGKLLTTDGTNASWTAVGITPTLNVVTGTTQAATAGNHYVLTNVAATTVTLPASPTAGDVIWVTVGNGLTTNVVARNGNNIQSLAENLTLDAPYAAVQMRYINSTIGWTFV